MNPATWFLLLFLGPGMLVILVIMLWLAFGPQPRMVLTEYVQGPPGIVYADGRMQPWDGKPILIVDGMRVEVPLRFRYELKRAGGG